MILPTKRLSEDRSLLAIGAEVLRLLNEPKTVSRLWEEAQRLTSSRTQPQTITFDWFVLGLDFLYTLNVVELEHGRLRRFEK